ncbi:MAG: hypothetical protein HY042_12650 [Spirochaetia bacterium]|nr:hypothetical protein [Spirochaetia bacterium]
MIPPFAEHALIKQFNELKKYFRKHETMESRFRVKNFRHFAKIMNAAGLPIAFDFLGSVNFGQAAPGSDVDVVLYLRCEDCNVNECQPDTCRTRAYVEHLLLRTLVREYSPNPYEVQVVDCVNLVQLDKDLAAGAGDSPVLLKFAFYRSICRSVNARLLRPYQMQLMENPRIIETLQPSLWILFDGLIKSSRHTWSLRKYQDRLRDFGVRIPASIITRIRSHLDQQEIIQGDGK